MAYIYLENVKKEIKGHNILNGISLSLDRGNIYGFSGANGCGKSILFRVISGLVVPTSGEILIDGKNLYKPVRIFPENIGIMIDAVGLFPYFNGFDNLSYLASIKNKINKEDVRKVIIRVGLDPDSKIPYSKYSLGMKQRLIIAQAIMETPDILIFDEPTNALDESGVKLFRDIVKSEKDRGATILISSHNSEDLSVLCDKIYHINNGSIESECCHE